MAITDKHMSIKIYENRARKGWILIYDESKIQKILEFVEELNKA